MREMIAAGVMMLYGCAGMPGQQMSADQIKAAADAGIVCGSAQGVSFVAVNTSKGVMPDNTQVTVEPGAGCKTQITTQQKATQTVTVPVTVQPLVVQPAK